MEKQSQVERTKKSSPKIKVGNFGRRQALRSWLRQHRRMVLIGSLLIIVALAAIVALTLRSSNPKAKTDQITGQEYASQQADILKEQQAKTALTGDELITKIKYEYRAEQYKAVTEDYERLMALKDGEALTGYSLDTSVATAYYKLGDKQKAITLLDQAEALAKNVSDEFERQIALNGIGDARKQVQQ